MMDNTPIGFMSYARSVDEHDDGKLTQLRRKLVGEVRVQSGDDNFDIFQDHIHIVWGEQWQARLDNTLDSVKLLIPIITPRFFKSPACRAEVERFAQREQQLRRNDLILPVYYIKTRELEEAAKRDADQVAQVIASHQHIDWRELRHDPLDAVPVRKLLASMAERIVWAMERADVAAPLPAEPQAARAIIQTIVPLAVPPAPIVPPAPTAPPAPTRALPAWASNAGQDTIGPWLEIEVAGVVQRFRWIEPGNFLMGSPKGEAGRDDDEGPQHRVTLSQGWWLADTTCTQALWQAVMGNNPSYFHAGNKGGPEHPVEQVSWHDVQRFMQVLKQCLPDCPASLPTEAEWEYACRAGTVTAFCFGETIGTEQINFDGNRPVGKGQKGEFRARTLLVKDLPANAWGLYQMHGNVWEWCADGWRSYEDKAVTDPGWKEAVKPPTGEVGRRVLRGGGWIDHAQFARSASRNHDAPDWLGGFAGFRLALRFPSLASRF